MKVLLCHNFYQQAGGEDESFADEARVLESHGHEVLRYTRESAAIGGMRPWTVARAAVWNRDTYAEVRELIARERPDVVHCTNIFPLISPAVYGAAHHERVAVVQALRNYRFICPGALLFRDGGVCEACLHKRVAWPAVVHGCYRDSRLFSAALMTILAVHRARDGWAGNIDMYFAPSHFTRRKYVEAGLPADRIAVSPNFVHPDPGLGGGSGDYAVFVGRLSHEKGLETLLAAWRHASPHARLLIVGDGPEAEKVKEAVARGPRVEWLGRQPSPEVLRLIGEAACLIMPSVTYETFGRTIVEAFSRGTPVVVSGIGAMAELVEDGRTGFHARAGDAADLADKIGRILSLSAHDRQRMRDAARQEYLQKYTAGSSYERLMGVYAQAREFRRARTS